MQPLHILIDTVFFTRPYSGISKVWETILNNFKPNIDNDKYNKYKITILLREGSQFKNINLDLNSKFNTKFNIVHINAFNYATMGKDVDYLNHIAKELKGDIFISTYFTYCTIISNWLMVHDMIPEKFKMSTENPMWIQKDLAIKNAYYFTTVSNNTKHDLLHFYPYLKNAPYIHNISTIYNAVIPILNPDHTFISSNGIKPKSYIFSIITNNEPYKNGKLVTEFAAKYSELLKSTQGTNIPIILLAKFPSENPVLKDNVLYMTNVSDTIVASLYANALCVIVPSLYEGFGLPIVEALQYGTPVLAIQNDVFDEIAPDALIYFENNVDSLWLKVSQLLPTAATATISNFQNILNTKLENGLKHIKSAYNTEKQMLDYTDFITMMISDISLTQKNSLSSQNLKSNSFINIIIQSYKETDPARLKELELAITNNLNNPYVKFVWDLGVNKSENSIISNNPKYKHESSSTIPNWITYESAFEFASRKSKSAGNYWCLCNLDIYLEPSSKWNLSTSWLNRNYILALSRHEYKCDTDIAMDSNFDKIMHAHTQDAWLFKTPFRVANCNFEMGMLGCDNAICDRIIKSGFKILNAPQEFKIVHIDIVKGKTSENFIEKHQSISNQTAHKPKNKHPERIGCYLAPNYNKICDMFSIAQTGGMIDLNALADGFGADNMERYEIACKLFTSHIKIQNPD